MKQKNETKQIDMFWKLAAIVFAITTIALTIIIIYQKPYEGPYAEVLLLDANIQEASETLWDAQEYYNLASLSYEQGDMDYVVVHCENARDNYLEYTQKLRTIKASINSNDKLLTLRKQMLEKEIYRAENMFEACEHFESAARYYDIYYDPDTPYDDPSYDMGGTEIDAMNEKIDEHDKTVREYNDLLAEYTVELKRRLE